jgi:hypothetical protein
MNTEQLMQKNTPQPSSGLVIIKARGSNLFIGALCAGQLRAVSPGHGVSAVLITLYSNQSVNEVQDANSGGAIMIAGVVASGLIADRLVVATPGPAGYLIALFSFVAPCCFFQQRPMATYPGRFRACWVCPTGRRLVPPRPTSSPGTATPAQR